MSGIRGHAADPVETLDDIDAVFKSLRAQWRNGRPREPQAVIRCGYCNSRTKRVVREAARTWYLAHDCASPFAAVARRSPVEVREQPDVAYLRVAQAAAQLVEAMRMAIATDVIYRGGHRHGLTPVTPEARAHHARVDAILTRLLGGVPTGRPPRLAVVAQIEELRTHSQHRQLDVAA